MHAIAKVFIVTTSIVMLVAMPLVGSAQPQAKPSAALKACRDKCKSDKDNTIYERCMIKCDVDEKGKKPK